MTQVWATHAEYNQYLLPPLFSSSIALDMITLTAVGWTRTINVVGSVGGM